MIYYSELLIPVFGNWVIGIQTIFINLVDQLLKYIRQLYNIIIHNQMYSEIH